MKLRHGARRRICVVTFPLDMSGVVPLSNIVDILKVLSDDLCLITGNAGYEFFKSDTTVRVRGIRHVTGANPVTRVLRFFLTQLRMTFAVVAVARKTDIVFLTFGGETSILPMLAAKLLRKTVIVRIASYSTLTYASRHDPFSAIMRVSEAINLALCDRIIVSSKGLIAQFNLEKHRKKIAVALHHFVDVSSFRVKTPLRDRKQTVAYIGRFNEEKGIMGLVEAIPAMLEGDSGIRVLIAGDGLLRPEVERFIHGRRLDGSTRLVGWIPHDRLADCLNEARLLVIPSSTETGPLIALEAMACGTPVLATRVGYIPDIIRDGETGFILEDNSAECIAASVLRVVGCPGLQAAADRARAVIEREFTFELRVEEYRRAIDAGRRGC